MNTTEMFFMQDNVNKAYELFLTRLRYKDAELVSVGSGDDALMLDDPQSAWLVYTGSADIFSVPIEKGKPVGSRQYMFSIKAGNLLLGFDLSSRDIGLLVNSARGAKLLKVEVSRLQELIDQPDQNDIVAFLIDRWLYRLSLQLTHESPPRDFTTAYIDRETQLAPNDTVMGNRDVIWVSHLQGKSLLLGNPDYGIQGENLFPLAKESWLKVEEETRLYPIETATYLKQDPSWSALQRYHDKLLTWVSVRVRQATEAEQARLKKKYRADRTYLEEAFFHIAETLGEMPKSAFSRMDDASPLLSACRLVGDASGIHIVTPVGYNPSFGYKNPAYEIARASRVRLRKVALQPGWWEKDSGALLAYIKEDKRPVALLPTQPGHYEMHDPTTKTITPITSANATDIDHFGSTFYRRFEDRVQTAWGLLKFGLREGGRDMQMVLAVGILTGMLNITTPIVTRIVFDDIIPAGNRALLLQIGLALILSALAVAAFQVTQAVAVLRLQSRAEATIQAGLWDRLLDLPASFFRDYAAGDLATRAMGISFIRKLISGTVTMSVLAGIFSIFNLALMFYYSPLLALLAAGLVLIAVAFTVGAGYVSVRIQRRLTDMQGKISGYVLQFINGIAKFRVANAQDRVFSVWANEFSKQRKATYQARNVENWQRVFHAVYPVMATMALFAMIYYSSSVDLSVGTFVAFNTAFTQFLVAALQLSAAILIVMSAVPMYERAYPILETLPEIGERKANPGELNGEIEVSHVTFGYNTDGPVVLNDVSFIIEPGEFVAVVGASGCGKSTLMRLLLGFEKPLSGVIAFDGKDLADLDLHAVRRQMGVVLQSSQLMSGSDIFSNIVGSTSLTMDDAWEAARMAGLEQDIKDMPMGMHTILSQGGSTISGGQRQRLLIARAIATRPRILFFDEATSALDNATQAMVSESLERLDATRIVIAHRLSTIINADHILVMDKGEVVQMGTYKELIKQPGVFADLAKRQLA